MPVDVLIPKIGFSMNEGLLTEWLVPDGSTISSGEPLYSLESEKSTTEVESPAAGTLRIVKEAGEIYEVGTLIAVID